MLPSMDLRRLTITKPIYLYTPITRPLTCVTSTAQQNLQTQQDLQNQPPPPPLPPPESPNPKLGLLVSSILSKKSLDSSRCKELVPQLSPHEFDRFLLDSQSNVNPKTASKSPRSARTMEHKTPAGVPILPN